MKKILLIFIFTLLSIFTFTTTALALSGIWMNTKGLKVYIPPKDMLTTTMTHAFQEWQRKTNNYFSFQFVNTKSTANIEVIFMDSGIPEICKNDGALGCTKVSTLQNHLGTRIRRATVYISRKSNNGRVMSNTQVYTIMLHEIGHALGLGHTKEPTSIMYAGTNQTMATKQEIQISDLNLLYNLYHSDEKKGN